jgi:hypothetical protein
MTANGFMAVVEREFGRTSIGHARVVEAAFGLSVAYARAGPVDVALSRFGVVCPYWKQAEHIPKFVAIGGGNTADIDESLIEA